MRRKLEVPATEKVEEAGCIELYRAVGAKVYKTSQPRSTMMTPGIPDLFIVHPKLGAWWHEVKRCQCEGMRKVNTKQSPDQTEFQAHVESAGHTYLIGCMCEAERFLREGGLLV